MVAAARSGSRVEVAAGVLGIGAVAGLVASAIDAATIRNDLTGPDAEMLSSALHHQVWWDWFSRSLPLVVLPALTAILLLAALRTRADPDPTSGRLSLVGACTWLIGVVVAHSSTPGFRGGGWFNYAPNAGVLFSPGEVVTGLTLDMLGLAIACIGVVVVAGTGLRAQLHTTGAVAGRPAAANPLLTATLVAVALIAAVVSVLFVAGWPGPWWT